MMALEDFFRDSPNYVNPDYVTPEQRKQQRTYAEMLMKRSSEKVTRPSGVLANMIDALTGRLEMNRAGGLEQQALAHQNATDIETQRQLMGQGGQQTAGMQPSSVADGGPTPPMGSASNAILPPAEAPTNAPRAEVQSSPKVWGDKEAEAAGLYPKTASLSPGAAGAPSGPQGQPPNLPLAGAPATSQPATFNQRFAQVDPRLIAGTMNNQMASPQARALAEALIGQKQGSDVYGNATREGLNTGIQRLPTSAGVTQGYRAPETVGPAGITTTNVNPAPGYGGQSVSNEGRRANLAAEGRGYQAATTLNQAQADTTKDIIQSDAKAGYAATDAKKALGIQKQNIEKWGHLITFGPAGDASLKGKEFLVNAGLGGADLAQATAAAESINKMGTQLASSLAQSSGGGRTENEYFNLLRSVPGLTGSQQGALYMNDIMEQSENKKQQLLAIQQDLARQGRMADYPRARQDFFKEHPIVNPVTGHDIELDFKAAKQQGGKAGGGAKIIGVEPPR